MNLKDLNNKVDALGNAILAWARPAGWPVSPLANYPLADFKSAFYIAFGYLAFVLIGSVIMKFSPYKIKGLFPFKFLYNITQVMLCSYMCIEAGVQAYKANYTLLPCQKFDQKTPPIAFILYIFYLSKVLDFVDTIFIIAEKRWAQLSFLHVYHHFSIFLFYWLNVTVGYDGDVYLTIVLNGLIHTIMYTYYFVSLHTKDIFWKSALTIGQMVQFIVMNLQAGYLMYYSCKTFPPRITEAYLYYIVTLLALFFHFYLQSYVFKKKGGKSSSIKKD